MNEIAGDSNFLAKICTRLSGGERNRPSRIQDRCGELSHVQVRQIVAGATPGTKNSEHRQLMFA